MGRMRDPLHPRITRSTDIDCRVRLTLFAVLALASCGGAEAPLTSPPPSAFSHIDLVAGTGPEARRGARLTVHYTGWLYDASRPDNKGKQFDSSLGSEPFTFRLGAGDVIRGWDQGFERMRVRGKRRLIIPPNLGYGAMGTPDGTIPANMGLVFEMELLDVR
jgi:FKBP-type peptidyl-prolyl cis-trans isomerase FkpA